MNRFGQDFRVLMIANFLSSWDGRRSYAEDLRSRLLRPGIRILSSSSIAFKPARLADMVLSALGGRGGYDATLVEVYSGQAFLWAESVSRVVKACGKPLVLALHGGNLPQFAASNPGRIQRVLETASEVIAPSAFLRNAFLAVRPDIRLISNAIDLDSHVPRRPGPARPRLFWLRAFHSMYQPEMAIRVLHKVASRYSDAHLTMAGVDKGDGSLESCRRLVATLGLGRHITFAGCIPKTEVGTALSQADIFLNTTTIDNAPVSVLEALASGLCVISTNVGGVPYLVQDGQEALLVGPSDEDRMADLVCRVVEEPGLAQRLSEAGLRKSRSFGWDSILPQWLEVLSRVASGRKVAAAC